ncbi:MAG: acylphosphatase [Desulfobulbaceae bacterium]|nr:acylphosphatase [Desulfobulbaceae bacterium]
MALVRMNAVVYGRVQGVYFRDFTVKEAERLCLTGWVRNLADGAVEAEFQGEEGAVALMVNWLHQGSPLSQVSLVQTRACTNVERETAFSVRY